MSPFFNTDKKLISNFVKNGALGGGAQNKVPPTLMLLYAPSCVKECNGLIYFQFSLFLKIQIIRNY